MPNDLLTNNLLLLLSFAAVVLLALFFCLILGRKKETKSSIFLEVSETFKNEVENLIKKEMEIAVLELREKIQKVSNEIEREYKEKTANLVSEIDKEISKIDKIGLENQNKILKEAENKIKDLQEGVEKNLKKFEDVNLKTQALLLTATKNKSDELAKGLTEEISGVYQAVKDVLSQKIAETDREIENYKKERLKEIDEKIYRMLGEIAKKTIGKAIDLSTHEELVEKTFEKAKKEIF